MERIKIAHLTTAHPRSDTRIRVREAGSLAETFGGPVALFVQDGKGNSIEAGGRIHIIDTGVPPSGRLTRMTLGVWRMWRAVQRVRPQVVHFHDPELITLGLILKCFRYRVVYDVHEDLPRQVLMKYWLPAIARQPVSWAVTVTEWLVARVFDAIVAAEPEIAGRFPSRKTTLAQNFPILDELVRTRVTAYERRPPHFAYIGSISEVRGVREMVQALTYMEEQEGKEIRLHLGGAFQPLSLRTDIQTLAGWQQVDFPGWANRMQVAEILGRVRGGLVILHPTQKYLAAYPTKLFEYMSVGLPVIASDFPLWRRIVDAAECGLLVNPLAPRAVADAMQWILDHPAEAETMGQRGRQAVEKHYNWDTEAEKLVALYKKLLPA